MNKTLLYFLSSAVAGLALYPLCGYAQNNHKKKPAQSTKVYKQGPSYIDAHLYKIQGPQDTAEAYLQEKLKLKVVHTPVYGPVTADCLPDTNLALKQGEGVYFEKPHRVAWFTFVAPEDTTLVFDLIPVNKKDDIDFLLFKDDAEPFINALTQHRAKPIRSNIARYDKLLRGKTGLSAKGTNNYEPPGKHFAYSKPLHVKKGERFYLAADNYTRPNGAFILYLHLRWPAAPQPTVKPKHAEHISDSIRVNLVIADSAGVPVKTRLKIAGVTAHKLIDVSNVSAYSLVLQHRQSIVITCIAKGYLLAHLSLMSPNTGTVINDTITLSAIGQNKNMVFRDIQFEPAQAAFLPQAREPLSNLLAFMQSNPTVHILIKGYVNDPMSYNSTRYDQNLSEERSKAVMQYLISKGIASSRMQWIGYGNRNMLYPSPTTWQEAQANRRVEIEVK